MLRPKDILDELSISAPSLRLWSKHFSDLLSPGAQSSQTATGGNAQRRYNQDDLELFRKAKRFLDSGKTYEETLAALQAQEPVPEPPEAPPAHEIPTTELAVIEPIHPVIRAFEEALRAKDETIEALHLVVISKDSEMLTLQARIEELKAVQVVQSAPPRFRWRWLERLLTGGSQDVG